MEKQRRSRRWLIAILAIFLFFFLGHEAQKRRFNTGDRGYSSVTSKNPPANLHAMAHASEMDDNLFHTSHYWIVQGPIESLRELAPAPGFERSDADAREVLESISVILPVGNARMLEGYEGSETGGRDHWLTILEPGDRAVFAW